MNEIIAKVLAGLLCIYLVVVCIVLLGKACWSFIKQKGDSDGKM